MRPKLGLLMLALVVGLASALLVFGQVITGTISGTVVDKSGAVVPNARVTVTNTEKGTSVVYATNARGYYTAPFLIPGTYQVSVEKAGFQNAVRSGFVLQVDQYQTVNFTLSVGRVTQTVRVTAAPPLVESQTSSLGQVIARTPVEELPLNGRNFAQLVWLAPGVTSGVEGENLSGNSTYNPRAASDFNAYGSTEYGNAWLVDGIVDNEYTFNTVIVQPSVESIEEFKVLSGNYEAEYGRGAAVVTTSTRSGTNQWHGSAMDYLRNTALNARNYFAAPTAAKPPFIRNQFEATLGGPVIIPKIYNGHDKTFMFLDYFGERQIEGESYVSSVPTMAVRSGDFSNYTSNGQLIPIYNPLTGTENAAGQVVRQQFTGNVIPTDLINPVGARVASIYPLPNAPGNFNNYLNSPDNTVNDNGMNVRVDHVFSPKDSLFARVSYEAFDLSAPSGGQSDCCLPSNPAQRSEYDLGPWVSGFKITALTTSGMAVGETHIISPTLVNNFLGGYARTDPYTIQSDYGLDSSTALGMENINVNQFATGLPNITVQEFTGLDGGPAFLPVKPINTLEQIGDTISWVKGRHQLSFGFRGINDDDDPFAGNDTRGAPNFEDNFTNNPLNPSALAGSGMATMLLGYSTSGIRWYLSSPYYLRSRQESAFAQDDWRVSSRLTLNLGIRWDRFGSPTEKYNHIANFDPATDALIYAGVNGTPADVDVRTQDHNFAPRVGFAFEPTANGKTVVRGGFGIYYFPLPITGSGNPGQFPPYTVAQSYSPPTYPTAAQFATIPTINDLFGPPETSQPLTTAALNALAPVIYGYAFANQTPYMEDWNLDVQRQIAPTLLFEIAYAGSRGIHLEQEYNINQVMPGSGSLASRRLIQPLDNLSTIDYFSWGDSSNYDALELKLQKNVSHGLQFLVDYTWSKSLDYDEPIMGQAQTVTDLDAAYGPSSWDLQNRFTGSWVYMLPFGQGGQFANSSLLSRLVAGWEFDGISTINTGPPFSLSLNSGVNNGAPSWPNRICNGALSNPTASLWFNTACFVAPPENTFGNAARDLLFGPGTIDFDLAVVKNTKLTERLNMQFRAEAFNAFNTPSFSVADLNTAIGSPTAGVITGTNIDNREFEFALKLMF